MVKKYGTQILLIFICLFSTKCRSQEKLASDVSLNCLMGVDAALNRYVDSLNLISSPKDLPHFLDDYLLDWEWRNLWQDCLNKDGHISFRKVIIDRVAREDVLEWIIDQSNPGFDKVYVPNKLKSELNLNIYNEFPSLPFMEYSFRKLAKLRLEEIRKYKLNNKHK